MIKRITNCLITERTRLSGSTLDLMSSATRLGPSFQPLIQIYFPTILRLLARTNKLYITRTQSCISAIIHNTHLPHIMPYIAEGMSDKSATMRKGCAEAILEALSKNASGGMLIDKEAIERRGSLALIEEVIRKAAVDKEVKVREAGRQIWNVYKTEWSDRVDACVYIIRTQAMLKMCYIVSLHLLHQLCVSTSIFPQQEQQRTAACHLRNSLRKLDQQVH